MADWMWGLCVLAVAMTGLCEPLPACENAVPGADWYACHSQPMKVREVNGTCMVCALPVRSIQFIVTVEWIT